MTSPGLRVSTTAEGLAKGSTRSQNNILLNKNTLQREHGTCLERNFTGFCQESVNGVMITLTAPVGVTECVFPAAPLLSVLAGALVSPAWASLIAQMVKNLPAMQETQVEFLGQEDPLEKGMATHSSVLAWRIPWTKKPDGPQSMGSQSQTQPSN